MIDIQTNSVPGSADPHGDMKDRRRFLGAGVAATPFLMTLVSQPALGVTCFTPSRSLSKNTSISQQGINEECTGAQSPGNYMAQTDPNAKGKAYSWPIEPSTLMHPLFDKGSKQGITKFTKQDANGRWVSKTLAEALDTKIAGSAQVHFHIIGAYLNKLGGGGALIPDTVITADGIKEMWRQFALNGYYVPMANVQWNGAQIVTYLKDNGIVL